MMEEDVNLEEIEQLLKRMERTIMLRFDAQDKRLDCLVKRFERMETQLDTQLAELKLNN